MSNRVKGNNLQSLQTIHDTRLPLDGRFITDELRV